eukprot:1767251-Rhodomonas_salina.1
MSCAACPCQQTAVVKMEHEAVCRLLRFRNRKKYPIWKQHLQELFDKLAASLQASMEDVTVMLLLTLAYEECLRFDNILDVLLRDMIWTKQYVKIFLLSCKLDNCKDWQWCTILVSDSLLSAFQLLLQVLSWLLTFLRGVLKTFSL